MKFKCYILSFIFILIFQLICAENTINSCHKVIKLHKNYVCYVSEVSPKFENFQECNSEIIWTVTNSSAGSVQIEFQPCNYTDFNIYLNVHEDNKWRQHSNYGYRRLQGFQQDAVSPECSQNVKLQLEYIYSGFYQVEIQAPNSVINTSSKNLTTDYIKILIAGKALESKDQQRFADNKTYLVSTFNYPQHSNTIELCFHLDMKEKERIIWNISCPSVENVLNICEITVHGQQSISCTLKTEKNDVINECHLFGLTPGEYEFGRYIVNEPIRCNTLENIVWGPAECFWLNTIHITEEKITPRKETPTTANYYIYTILILIVTLITIILIIAYFLAKKIQKYQLATKIPEVVYHSSELSEGEDEEDPAILLLYARDCDEFMKTMSTFRQILQISGNQQIQVLDIHDPERNSEILTETPNTWLLTKIMDKNTKIVLVLSECGDYLLQKEGSYQEENCLDFLYNFGLRILLQHSFSMSSKKLFVTKFSYFVESRATTILSSDRRFNLDDFDNLRDLVKGLFTDGVQLWDNVLRLLQEPCRMLSGFVNENPNYLQDILHIST